MDTLLSVLLYLHALPGPDTYTSNQISQLNQQYQPQIVLVERYPKQLSDIMAQERPVVSQVVIVTDWNTGN
jgi:hypothetical protein